MVANIIGLIIEMVKMLLVLCGCLNYKMKQRFTGAWVVFGVSVLCLVIKGIQDGDYRVSAFYFIVVVISSMMIEGKRKGLLALVVFLGISCIDTVMVPVVQSLFSISEEEFYGNSFIYGTTNTISVVGITVAAILLQKLYYGRGKQGNQQAHNSGRLYLALFAIWLSAAMYTMIPFSVADFEWDKGNVILIIASVIIFSLLFVVMGVLLIYNNSAKRHYKEVARVNRNLLEAQERYYQMVLEKEEETRKFRHDMSSHLVCVKNYLEENKVQEAEEYLDHLNGSLRNLAVKHQTGNTLVNAIVNDVSGRYTDVTLDWKGHLPKQIQMSDMDVCVIFSNLLENAFLAASACEDGGIVDVTVKSVSGALAITVENNIARPIEEKDGRLITQKADKENHGYGTRNVRERVEKNDGTVTFEYTEKNFTVEVVLMNVA